MENFNLSQVQLYFQFGQLGGEYMNLRVNGIDVVPDLNDQAMIEVCVCFPSELVLELQGKNMNMDTIVDVNGNVIKDKFVQLLQVKIDRMNVSNHFLQKWPIINDSFVSNYFGFNGIVRLEFNAPTAFHWLLKNR